MSPTRAELNAYSLTHKHSTYKVDSGNWLARAAAATGQRIKRIPRKDGHYHIIFMYKDVLFDCKTTAKVGGCI